MAKGEIYRHLLPLGHLYKKDIAWNENIVINSTIVFLYQAYFLAYVSSINTSVLPPGCHDVEWKSLSKAFPQFIPSADAEQVAPLKVEATLGIVPEVKKCPGVNYIIWGRELFS